MPWKRFRFKGNKAYIRTDDTGTPLRKGSRVEIRYKVGDKRSYLGAFENLEPLSPEEDDGKIWPDSDSEESVQVDDAPKQSQNAGKRSPRKGSKPVGEGAKAAEGPYLNGLEPVVIYTDGACTGNPGPAGLGVVLTCGGKRKEVSEYLGQGTNNIAELTAIHRGLALVKSTRRTVLLHTDSSYSIGVLGGWKAKANKELIEAIKLEMHRFPDLRLIKVRGHAGVPENERCDQLARDAITSRSSR